MVKKQSRQRKWQIEQRRTGRCVVCGQSSGHRTYCKRHRKVNSAYQRNRYRAAHGIPLDAPLWDRRGRGE